MWQRFPQKDPGFPYMCFHLTLVHSTYFIFTGCRPRDDGTVLICKIAENIDDILSEHSSANIHICGNSSQYSPQRVIHRTKPMKKVDTVKTSPSNRYRSLICHSCSLDNRTWRTPSWTSFSRPETTGHNIHLIDLCFTSCPEKYSVEVIRPLGFSHYSRVSFTANSKP